MFIVPFMMLLGVHCITRITKSHFHCFSDPRFGALSPTKLPPPHTPLTHFVCSKSSSLAYRLAFVIYKYSYIHTPCEFGRRLCKLKPSSHGTCLAHGRPLGSVLASTSCRSERAFVGLGDHSGEPKRHPEPKGPIKIHRDPQGPKSLCSTRQSHSVVHSVTHSHSVSPQHPLLLPI